MTLTGVADVLAHPLDAETSQQVIAHDDWIAAAQPIKKSRKFFIENFLGKFHRHSPSLLA